jgi:hypothetical protein
MSSDDGEKAESVPTIIIKGGTTSGRYDREIARRKADAEQRRGVQDAMYERRAKSQTAGDLARIGESSFLTQGSPRLVLDYLNSDKTIRQQCKSEITMVPMKDDPTQLDMMFALVCPRCLERGLPAGESQMLVRNSHREFALDERKKGSVVMLEYTWGFREPVVIAGTVTCKDIIRCANHNCGYAVRIENSKVVEV